jgi:cell division protein FtsB
MFGMFRKSPLKKWEQERGVLLTKAFNAQRNGDIRQYSTLTAEADALRKKIENLKREPGE